MGHPGTVSALTIRVMNSVEDFSSKALKIIPLVSFLWAFTVHSFGVLET